MGKSDDEDDDDDEVGGDDAEESSDLEGVRIAALTHNSSVAMPSRGMDSRETSDVDVLTAGEADHPPGGVQTDQHNSSVSAHPQCKYWAKCDVYSEFIIAHSGVSLCYAVR